MACSSVCLFHDRRYSSNIQRILNLLRINIIKIKYDLNTIGKKSLCTCSLTDDQLAITDEELNKTQNEFEKIKSNLTIVHQWPEEIDRLLQLKIMNTCCSKISIYKLLKLICNISDETKFPEMVRAMQKDDNVHSSKQSEPNRHRNYSKEIYRDIVLSFPSNQIGHLIGRHGNIHKSIMEKTQARIHFRIVPYSISTRARCTDFNLDSFQSSPTVSALIIGTAEAIENATKVLEDLARTTQINISSSCWK